jgi:hypothetical protein
MSVGMAWNDRSSAVSFICGFTALFTNILDRKRDVLGRSGCVGIRTTSELAQCMIMTSAGPHEEGMNDVFNVLFYLGCGS